jgi:phosphoribosylformylglycinamidine cyclo-ligase (EC 6.3.3.1)
LKAYQKAGVDLAAADEAVEKLKPLAKRTLRPEVFEWTWRIWRIV